MTNILKLGLKLKGILFLLTLLPWFVLSQAEKRPNVILIITDDQGYGDLGVTGNHHLKTPVIDAFAK